MTSHSEGRLLSLEKTPQSEQMDYVLIGPSGKILPSLINGLK